MLNTPHDVSQILFYEKRPFRKNFQKLNWKSSWPVSGKILLRSDCCGLFGKYIEGVILKAEKISVAIVQLRLICPSNASFCRLENCFLDTFADRENEPRILRGEDTCGPNGIEGRKSPVLELERMSKEIIAKKLEINTTDEPRHKQFVNYSDRLKSFSSWPETFKIRPESLSEAGFYYTGSYCYSKHFCSGIGYHRRPV